MALFTHGSGHLSTSTRLCSFLPHHLLPHTQHPASIVTAPRRRGAATPEPSQPRRGEERRGDDCTPPTTTETPPHTLTSHITHSCNWPESRLTRTHTFTHTLSHTQKQPVLRIPPPLPLRLWLVVSVVADPEVDGNSSMGKQAGCSHKAPVLIFLLLKHLFV